MTCAHSLVIFAPPRNMDPEQKWQNGVETHVFFTNGFAMFPPESLYLDVFQSSSADVSTSSVIPKPRLRGAPERTVKCHGLSVGGGTRSPRWG